MSTSNGTSHRPVDRVLAELAARLETEPELYYRHRSDGTGYAITQRLDAEAAEKAHDKAWNVGGDTWASLLRVFFTGALASRDLETLRHQLMCLANASVRWVADIDSREEKP